MKRSDLAGHAGYGYCASHSRFYWGLKLYLVCAGDGMPIMWCLANPKLGERQVLAALLDHNHHLIRAGQVLLADKGFAGKAFKAHTDGLGIRLLRPDRRDETYRTGNLGPRIGSELGGSKLSVLVACTTLSKCEMASSYARRTRLDSGIAGHGRDQG